MTTEEIALSEEKLRAMLARYDGVSDRFGGFERSTVLSVREARSLVTELLALREAVKPFALFAADNVGPDGWEGSGCHKDRIVDWFGPSQFRALARALSHNPEPMK